MKPGVERRWLLTVAIVAVAVFLLFAIGGPSNPVNAETQFQAGLDANILVIPVQLERDNYGLAMIDTAEQTLWIYEINNRGPAHNRLRLLAARSWKYDRLLHQYNTADPKPKQVKLLLEQLSQQLEKAKKPAEENSGSDAPEATETNDSNS